MPSRMQKTEKQSPFSRSQNPSVRTSGSFSLTPYTFLPSVDVKFNVPQVTIGNRTIGGDISVNQPLWKTISKFSSNFYVLSLGGRLEAWKGRWGGFLDGYWIFGKERVSGSDSRLVFRDRVDITTSSSVTDRFGTGQINFGPQFKLGTAPLSPDSNVSFVLYGGGRVNWLTNDDDGTITIRASSDVGEIGKSFDFSRSRGRAFIEPMIGLKTSWTLGPKVKAILRGDVGGFGFVDSNNWDCDLETGNRLGSLAQHLSRLRLSRPGTVAGSRPQWKCRSARLVLWAGARRNFQLLAASYSRTLKQRHSARCGQSGSQAVVSVFVSLEWSNSALLSRAVSDSFDLFN